MMHIPLMDLVRQYNSLKTEIDSVVKSVIETASFVGGPEKDQFETEFAKACGVPHCIGVGNGTDSLFLILKALGISSGDEVVTAANSFIASSEAISATGARPVFIDIDPNTFNIDLNLLEELLEKRAHSRGGKIKAIMPVHLYGRIVDMPKVSALAKKYQLFVVEDTAQAHLAEIEGKRAGAWGDAGSFSFYPGKNLGAFGDAGAVITSDQDLAQRIRKLANHGRIGKYDHDVEGFNSRLDTLQAAVLRVKLRNLQSWSDARFDRAIEYDKMLQEVPEVVRPIIPSKGQHVFHLYVIRVKEREKVQEEMKKRGIQTVVHYPVALPNLAAYRYLGHQPGDFPFASKAAKEVLSLPLFPEMTFEEQRYVAKCLREALVKK